VKPMSQESDFDQVKRSGKEFLTGRTAGTGGGTGRGRFNPPPGWPPAPAGWVAPPGWQPDPSWPEPPPGWQLWVEDHPAISPKTQDSLLAMASGTAVILGSLMPWVSFSSADAVVNPSAKAASVICGLVVVALGFALRAALPGRLVAGIATLCLSSLAGLGYVGFMVAGITGVSEQDPFGDTTNLTFYPNIGIILAVAGCGAAFVAAIRSFHHRPGLTTIHAH
jgi:hypothetical protein